MDQIIPNAALPDPRPQPLRDSDYNSSEIAAAAVAALFANAKPGTIGATLYNQWYVGSCVLHGFYTQLEYEGIVAPSPEGMSQLRAYRKRSNYPNAGTAAVDAYTQIKDGQSKNVEAPTSPGMTEAMATAMPKVKGSVLIKDFKYFEFAPLSFWYGAKPNTQANDQAIAAAAAGKAIAIFIFATEDEWSQEYVEIKTPALQIGDAYVRHCVCIMPKGDFTENGKQWLAVQDSAAFGNRHLRYVSRDFFNKRAYYASQVFANDEIPAPVPPPAIGKPTTPCKLGDHGSAVSSLQTFLVEQKKLEAQYVTGYYGAITAKAVQWWQLEHWNRFTGGVPALLDLAGKYWGKESIAIINS
jgi:hypothetical protein